MDGLSLSSSENIKANPQSHSLKLMGISRRKPIRKECFRESVTSAYLIIRILSNCENKQCVLLSDTR